MCKRVTEVVLFRYTWDQEKVIWKTNWIPMRYIYEPATASIRGEYEQRTSVAKASGVPTAHVTCDHKIEYYLDPSDRTGVTPQTP